MNGSRLLMLALSAAPVFAQSVPASSDIPNDAVIIERAGLPVTLHDDRELVLWMISPKKYDRGPLLNNPYTCPEWTLGSYYRGPARLSLLDKKTGRVINTIKLTSSPGDADEFNLPYRILSGFYYAVPGVPKDTEGEPRLLALRDLNGDGIPAEAAFFEAEACEGLATTLIGYSPTQDKVIQYGVELVMTSYGGKQNGGKIERGERLAEPQKEILVWIDYLFSEMPIQPGHWKYDVDYTGRGGSFDSYDVHYDAARERFVGTLTRLDTPETTDLQNRR